jgi:glutamate racemase
VVYASEWWLSGEREGGRMSRHGTPRLIVLDSGLGGLSVLRALREAVPEASVTYIADDAFFPYGALADDALIARVHELVGAAIAELSPDAVVVACNTASTITMPHLRAAYALPFIGTVPAVKPAAQLSQSCMVSVLGTPATVRRDYTRALIATHGEGCEYTLVGATGLAAITETVMAGGEVADTVIAAEIGPCFVRKDGRRTDVVVLGCTHYPLLIARLEALAPWPVTWLDPAPAIARRTANVLAELGFVVGVGASRPRGEMRFTSGKAAPGALLPLLDFCGLEANSATMPGAPKRPQDDIAILESRR